MSSKCDLSSTLDYPDSKVHGANMGPTWVLSAPDGPHVGPMNLAIRVVEGLPHVSTTFQNSITDWEELKYWLEESISFNYIIICQTLIMLYNCVVMQKWPFLDVFAIHDNVSFSCHKDIVKLNGMTVSVDEYEKEWERRRMGNEWMKSKIKSLNEWSEWGTNDCKIP